LFDFLLTLKMKKFKHIVYLKLTLVFIANNAFYTKNAENTL